MTNTETKCCSNADMCARRAARGLLRWCEPGHVATPAVYCINTMWCPVGSTNRRVSTVGKCTTAGCPVHDKRAA